LSPLGVVLFAHGSGSGRFSRRNTFVARHLQQGRVATLLIDLLSPDEAEDRRNVLDIDLLAERVLLAKAWLAQDARTTGLGVNDFGASHLFEEPGRLEEVAEHALTWFQQHVHPAP
jgi:hypothetical protein